MKIQDREAFGRMMRERRKSLGFTLEQMAEATGISFATILRIELGRVGYLKSRTVKALEVPQRVINKQVTTTVPTAVMYDGSERPLAELKGVVAPQRVIVSGDSMGSSALKQPQDPLPWFRAQVPVKRKARPIVAQRKSFRQRFFLWLAGVRSN